MSVPFFVGREKGVGLKKDHICAQCFVALKLHVFFFSRSFGDVEEEYDCCKPCLNEFKVSIKLNGFSFSK